MKTILRWLIMPAVLAGLADYVRAQELGEPRKTGKVLLLKNGHAMEGDIEQVGTQYCIRRGTSEVWIAGDRALRLSPDWFDTYAYMQTMIKLDSAADRVKLARWCHMHKLPEEALEQVKAALQLQPENADAKQILAALEIAKKAPPSKQVVRAAAPTPPRPAEPAPTVDVTAESLVAFTAKVQPILMNLCASCHVNDSNGKFQLERVFESGHKVATQRNLAAVLSQVDLDRPTISPLLVKAITPHGREPLAPIRDRSAVPFQAMQHWIADTLQKNPQLKEYRDAQKSPSVTTPVGKSAAVASPPTNGPKGAPVEVSLTTPRLEMTVVPAAQQTQTTPTVRPHEPDWCDPAHFNDYYHPKR